MEPNLLQELKNLVESLTVDYDKFFNKKKRASGIRLRAGLQRVKILASKIRTTSLDLNKLYENR